MIWNEKIETMPLEDLKNIQSERLVALCEYVYANNPIYKQKFDDQGITPSDIKSIDDIVKLPFTTKLDMRDTYPFGLFSRPRTREQKNVRLLIARIRARSLLSVAAK